MSNAYLGFVMTVLGLINATSTNSAPVAPQACPALSVRITGVDVTPKVAAREHIVLISWSANTPTCYSIQKFVVTGALTFANGQSKHFAQTVAGNQTSVSIQTPGLLTVPVVLPALAPRSVRVNIAAGADAPIAGMAPLPAELGDGLFIAPPSTCLPLVQLTNPRAVFTGLAPGNPAGMYYPKIRVSWQTLNPPPCYKIEQFAVTVLLRGTGGVRTKSVTAPGSQTVVEIVFDNFPVSASFQAGAISARVTASGTAKIVGTEQRDFQLQ